MTCSGILPLWKNFSMHIYRKTTILRVGFNVNNVLFGELTLSGYNKVVNFIILYSKEYIINCSKEKKLILLGFYIIYYSNITIKNTKQSNHVAF